MKVDTHKRVGVYFFHSKIEKRRKRKWERKERHIGNGAKKKCTAPSGLLSPDIPDRTHHMQIAVCRDIVWDGTSRAKGKAPAARCGAIGTSFLPAGSKFRKLQAAFHLHNALVIGTTVNSSAIKEAVNSILFGRNYKPNAKKKRVRCCTQ